MTGPTAPRARPGGLSSAVIFRNCGELLGERKRRIWALASASTLSGLAEAGILAVVAKVAAVLATPDRNVSVHLGSIRFEGSVGAFLVVGGVLACVRLVLQAPVAYLPPRIFTDVQARLRTRLFDAFSRAGWDIQAADREGHLQELMGSQALQASRGAVQATTLVTNASAFAVMLASALALNAAAAGVVIGVLLVFFAATRPLTVAGVRYARGSRDAQLAHGAGVSESSRLAEATQAFGVAAAQREHVDALVERVRQYGFRAQLLNATATSLYPSLVFLLLVGGLTIVDVARFRNLATLGAVVLLLARAAGYGSRMHGAYQNVKLSVPFVERLRAEEERYRRSAPLRGPKRLERVERLAFEDVGFAYRPHVPVLEHVTFEIRAGEAVGIVGPSGSGKSTLAQLLLRLRLPTSGRYLVNGQAADEFLEEDWHGAVAYVPQAPQLIHASVAENISYLRDVPDADVERAARLAGVHDEVIGWRDGYDTIVGPRADAVSGGQAQRICLARALVGQPRVLLLDEPSSAVDSRSEGMIRESLRSLKGEVTLLVIAHQLTTIDMCDRVMVLVGGRLDSFGPVADLQARSAYFDFLRSIRGEPTPLPASPADRVA